MTSIQVLLSRVSAAYHVRPVTAETALRATRVGCDRRWYQPGRRSSSLTSSQHQPKYDLSVWLGGWGESTIFIRGGVAQPHESSLGVAVENIRSLASFWRVTKPYIKSDSWPVWTK